MKALDRKDLTNSGGWSESPKSDLVTQHFIDVLHRPSTLSTASQYSEMRDATHTPGQTRSDAITVGFFAPSSDSSELALVSVEFPSSRSDELTVAAVVLAVVVVAFGLVVVGWDVVVVALTVVVVGLIVVVGLAVVVVALVVVVVGAKELDEFALFIISVLYKIITNSYPIPSLNSNKGKN